MKSEIIKDMIYETLERAVSGSCEVYDGERIAELDLNQAKYVTAVFDQIAVALSTAYIGISDGWIEEKKMEYLFVPYLMCFDKAIEATYNLRAGLNKPIDFDTTTFMDYTFGTEIPEVVMSQFPPQIWWRAESVFDEMYFYCNEVRFQEDRQSLYEGLYLGAVQMGVETCLRVVV